MLIEDRVKFIEHNKKQILHIDASNLAENDVLVIIELAKKYIRSQKPKSLLVITDVANTRYNAGILAVMRSFVTENTPFIKASAVIGASIVKKTIIQNLSAFSERELKTFDNITKAKDWLGSL